MKFSEDELKQKKRDFAQIVMALQTYYPRENLLPTEASIDLWFRALCDIDARVLAAALNKWVMTQKWPPTIAELREQAQAITEGELPSWGKAWETVQDAVHCHGYYEYNAAVADMDAITRAVVDFIGWQNICLSTNHEATRANFRDLYEREAKRRKEERNIPEAVKTVIANIQRMLQQKEQEKIESGKEDAKQ